MAPTGFFKLKRHNNWKQKWGENGPKEQTDAVIVVGNVRIPVHNTIIAAGSRYYRQWLAVRPQKTEIPEIQLSHNLESGNVHTAWRVIELLYCQSYTLKPCPLVNQPGDCFLNAPAYTSHVGKETNNRQDDRGHLERRAAVYQLAEYLGLPQDLQDIAFDYYRRAIEKEWEVDDLLNSINVILKPVLELDTLQSTQKDELQESRIVDLMFYHLHKRRILFKDDRLLSLHLQSCSVFLDIFVRSWTNFRGN
ncbi:uncharacterized protein AKAW2_30029A [Aspergillus luchuensis]|uniref:BTB domain-containing protein n=1 Tax=Aspergillus kawachii TaxID=1069201 RepID=A0A7R7ZW47_ASPKA|nr:uncharacterized protein AKAW2_30029A [Aspergillus luchuensis]BCR96710.1 hypothetical protein AKAW2_30029A [Aspergillus luchuensis]GAA93049.1 hypothetical protein AKAW_11161 [Aspergillus luchuensis IFO 4308]